MSRDHPLKVVPGSYRLVDPGALALGEKFQGYALWHHLHYEARFALFGTTAIILPFGDPYHGLPSATTFTTQRATATGVNAVFTWSEAPSGFDAPLNLFGDASFRGAMPIVRLNGTDEEADSLDAPFFTFSSGAFSIACSVYLVNATSRTIISKWDETTGAEVREWALQLDGSGRLEGVVYDETTDTQIARRYSVALTLNTWYHIVMTYAGGTAATDIKLYLDGVQVDDVTSQAGPITDMRDTASLVRLGMVRGTAAQARFFSGRMAGASLGTLLVNAEATADQAARDYNMHRRALAL